MRFLLVSDLHYRLRQFDWVIAAAPAFDAVVVAGDLLGIRSPVALHVQAIAVSAALRALAEEAELLVASGNHDLDGRNAAGEKAALWMAPLAEAGVHLDGTSLLLDGDLFTVCPWWDGPRTRAELDATLAEAAARPRRLWVWVHHAPPGGSPLAWDGRRTWGDEALSGWIGRYRPDLVLTGHVHQAPFVPGGSWADRVGSAWAFNAGHQPGPVPAHVAVDLAVGTAVWTAAADSQEIALDGPDAR